MEPMRWEKEASAYTGMTPSDTRAAYSANAGVDASMIAVSASAQMRFQPLLCMSGSPFAGQMFQKYDKIRNDITDCIIFETYCQCLKEERNNIFRGIERCGKGRVPLCRRKAQNKCLRRGHANTESLARRGKMAYNGLEAAPCPGGAAGWEDA